MKGSVMTSLTTNRTSTVRPLKALLISGWQTSRRDTVTRVALATVYCGLVVILSGLYRVTPFERFSDNPAITYQTAVWYMAITELVAIAVWTQFREVREEVINHQFSGLLLLPISYVALKSGEWLGRCLENMVRFVLIGGLLAWFLTGVFPFALTSLPGLFLSLALAAVIFNLLHLLVGLTEVWGAHARPTFLIVQKLLFLLGGLLYPLDIYPDWLERIAWATPFPAILYGPGSFAFGDHGVGAMRLLALQIFWIFVLGGLATLVLRAAKAKIGRDGD